MHYAVWIAQGKFEKMKLEQRKKALLDYLKDVIPFIKKEFPQLKAYVYNIDEPWGKKVAYAKNTYQLIKHEFGHDVTIMQNTNQNNDKVLKKFDDHIDAIDINLGFYDITRMESYRKSSPKEFADVWWNLNIWPRDRPNLFLEYPLIDARIIGPVSVSASEQAS